MPRSRHDRLAAAGAGAEEGQSRTGAMQAIPRVLEELRLDPAEVLGEVGVDAGLFADPDNLIQDALVGRALGHCAVRSGREDFALRVGRQAQLASLGLVGTIAASAPNVGTALREISRFLGFNDGAAILSLSVGPIHATLNYAIYEAGVEGAALLYQMVGAVTCSAMRELCGPDWAPTQVWLPCRAPADPSPFRAQFRSPVRFDAPRFALLFPRRWLERPPPAADAALHAALLAQAAALESQTPLALPTQVRRFMRHLLLDGKGSLEIVARNLSMHRRTLDRHLDASGCSFRTLANAMRFEVASQLLRDTDMSVSEIAVSLHYGDASAFAHAFRRWAGRTPSQWRRSAPGGVPRSPREPTHWTSRSSAARRPGLHALL